MNRMHGLAGLVLVLAASPALAQDFHFEPWIDHRNQDFYEQDSIAIGDVTGDGRDDVVISAVAATSHTLPGQVEQLVLVYVQGVDGGLMTPLRIEVGPDRDLTTYDTGLALGDMDGDGLLDIVASHDDLLSVLLSDGCGGFTRSSHDLPERAPEVAVVDFDLDGDLDVFALSWLEGATLLHGDGTGDLVGMSHRDSAAGGYNAVKVGDVTGDGHDDVVVASVQSTSLFEVHASSPGGFAPTVRYPLPEAVSSPSGLAIGDWNGDGRLDIAMSVYAFSFDPDVAEDRIVLYTQQADGSMAAPTYLPTFRSAEATVFGDLDGDGYDDLIVFHGGWWSISYYFGGPEAMSEEHIIPSRTYTSWFRPDAVATGDINGDGCVDLAYADPGSSELIGALAIHAGSCSAPAPTGPFHDQLATCGLDPVHDSFDGDRASDILWRHGTKGSLEIWSAAEGESREGIGSVDMDWSIAGKGDFDGDGVTDVLWRNRITGANAVWHHAEAGLRQTLRRVASQDWQVAGIGDFDGDGRDDLFWRNARTGANAIWPGGDAASQPVVANVRNQAWQVAGIGDFDRDGRDDVFWRNGETGANVVWNRGRRSEQSAAKGVRNQAWQVAGVGDFDGDGRADLFWRNDETGANVIWDGADYDAQTAVMGVNNLEWVVAAIGDYDGDRPSDVLWRNTRTGANVIWMQANYWTQRPADHVANVDWMPQ